MAMILLFLPVVVTGLVSSWALVPTCASLAGGVALFLASSVPPRHWFLYLIRPWFILPPSPMELADFLVDMANVARKDGILALEKSRSIFHKAPRSAGRTQLWRWPSGKRVLEGIVLNQRTD